jgi:hypothetical protein
VRLNQANLRTTLAAIFDVDPQYIVPKQGTWWNPQAVENNPTKPLTWCAFRIDGQRTITAPFYVQDAVPSNIDSVLKIGRLTLQFVGDQAEDLANSIAHWVHRDDVLSAFDAYDAKVLGDVGEVVVSDFDQQGENSVLAYNVTVRIAWADEIGTLQQKWPSGGVAFQPGAVTV